MTFVKIQPFCTDGTTDGEPLHVDFKVFAVMGTFVDQDALLPLAGEGVPDQGEDNIHIAKIVDRKTLEQVVKWIKHFQSHDNAEEKARLGTEFTLSELLHILNAANYLDVTELIDLSSAAVANIIKVHTPEDNRKLFCITETFTPEELQIVRRQNQWLTEDNQ